jgi:HAMP domain-containing protein
MLDCEIPQSTKFRESDGITYLTLGNAKEVEALKTSIERLAATVRRAMGI